MLKPEPAGGPTPQLFFQTANAYQRSQALKAAVELDFFTAIGLGHDQVPALAERCGAAQRGVRILADYLTIQGFLTKEGDRYKLTPDSQVFLDRRSPAYMGSVLGFLHAPKFIAAFDNLTEAVRKGGTVAGDAGTVTPEHPLWVDFARSMIPMMVKPAEEIGIFVRQSQPNVKKVLDVAAGHGLFGIEIAARCPEAEVTALDWPNVLTVARELAQKSGLESRYHTIAGDAFQQDLGSGYDLVLLTNFLHHFSVPTCEALLLSAASAPETKKPQKACTDGELAVAVTRASAARPRTSVRECNMRVLQTEGGSGLFALARARGWGGRRRGRRGGLRSRGGTTEATA